MENAVMAKGLTKIFQTRKRTGVRGFFGGEKENVLAVDHVDFEIRKGEIFGLLGPNGAGKTTTIKMLCTLLEPTDGEAYVNRFHVVRDAERVRETIGVMLTGERTLYWKLTGRENLEYFAALYHVPAKIARKRVQELLELVELHEKADVLVEDYSSGMRVRLSFAKALLNDAPLIFFDEPTLGMDPQSARRMRDVIQKLKDDGHTVLLTTHYMEEADLLCDRVAIIDHGKFIALGAPSELKARSQLDQVLEVEVHNMSEQALSDIKGLQTIQRVALQSDDLNGRQLVRIQTHESRDTLPQVLQILAKHAVNVRFVKSSEPTLEDVFIQLTGRTLRD